MSDEEWSGWGLSGGTNLVNTTSNASTQNIFFKTTNYVLERGYFLWNTRHKFPHRVRVNMKMSFLFHNEEALRAASAAEGFVVYESTGGTVSYSQYYPLATEGGTRIEEAGFYLHLKDAPIRQMTWEEVFVRYTEETLERP